MMGIGFPKKNNSSGWNDFLMKAQYGDDYHKIISEYREVKVIFRNSLYGNPWSENELKLREISKSFVGNWYAMFYNDRSYELFYFEKNDDALLFMLTFGGTQ